MKEHYQLKSTSNIAVSLTQERPDLEMAVFGAGFHV